MKHKLLLLLTVISTMLVSCDMDLAPIGSIDDKKALATRSDAASFRNSFYVSFRSFTTSAFFAYPEIQADMFNGLTINGNNMGTIANGIVLSGDIDIASYWLACFARIANINYFLQKIQPLVDKAQAENNEEDLAYYDLYIGEARFFRGFYYACMFDRWCQVYSADKGDTPGLGLPLVTIYNPTDDRSTYPGRSTMNETIKFIKDDFQAGLTALLAYEEVDDSNVLYCAEYLSSYVVKAMQARFALWIGDYQTALDLSAEIIDSGKYPLSAYSSYSKIWTNDTGTELLMVPYEDTQELAGAYGDVWIKKDTQNAWYIPSSNLIADYASAGGSATLGYNDPRYTTYIKDRNLVAFGVTIQAPCFYKFPGNTALDTSSGQNLYNKAKPFRTSELYMIAAESAYMLGNETLAAQYYNDFCKVRIRKFSAKDLTSSELIDHIRHQRSIELVGEGFRISDLRRWHKGFSREDGADYTKWPDAQLILTPAGLTVSYSADDHRYTWPIPSDEIQSNPQMAGQQNPGY